MALEGRRGLLLAFAAGCGMSLLARRLAARCSAERYVIVYYIILYHIML